MENVPGQNINQGGDAPQAGQGTPPAAPVKPAEPVVPAPAGTPAGQDPTPAAAPQQYDPAYVERLQQQLTGRTQQTEDLQRQVKTLEDKGKPWQPLIDSGADPELLGRMAAAAKPPEKLSDADQEAEMSAKNLRAAGFVHKDDLDQRDQRRNQEEAMVQAYERENLAIDAAAAKLGYDTNDPNWEAARHEILVRLDSGVIDADGKVTIPPALNENNQRLLANPTQIQAAVESFSQSVAVLHAARVKHLGNVPDAPPGGTGSGAGTGPAAGGEAQSLVAVDNDKDRLEKAQAYYDQQRAKEGASASSEM